MKLLRRRQSKRKAATKERLKTAIMIDRAETGDPRGQDARRSAQLKITAV